MSRFPAVSAALKKGKEPVDIQVENALLKRALGYEYEETYTDIEDQGGGRTKKHVRKVKKHMPGDTTAMIFWLKNRKPEQWREKQEYTATTALDKLDAILAENIKNANRQAK